MEFIIGQIFLWAIGYEPADFLLCDGRLLSIGEHQTLFSVIGNTFGGDGTTTFALPDLRSRVPVGAATLTGAGQVQGAATASVTAQGTGTVTLTSDQLPAHSHTASFQPGQDTVTATVAIPATSTVAASDPGTSTILGTTSAGGFPVKTYSTGDATTTLKPFSVQVPTVGGTVTNGPTGEGQAVNLSVSVPVTVSTLQPALTLNYFICVNGIYPARP